MLTIQRRLKILGFSPGPLDGQDGPKTRQALKAFQKAHGLLPDGISGPKTRTALFSPKNPWPKQADVSAFFGSPGENLERLPLPFTMRLAWQPEKKIRAITLNKKVSESARRCFEKIARLYSTEKRQALGIDLFGGSFNIRNMRGSNTLSMHAFGVAIDFDPLHNALTWGEDKARLAQAELIPFWETWEEEGWTSLGRAKNFDWMHVQAASLG